MQFAGSDNKLKVSFCSLKHRNFTCDRFLILPSIEQQSSVHNLRFNWESILRHHQQAKGTLHHALPAINIHIDADHIWNLMTGCVPDLEV